MAQALHNSAGIASINSQSASLARPSYQAYQILRLGFTVAPIVAGLDKFFHLLVNWDQYLPGTVNALTGGHGHQLMLVVGVIEIVAGLGMGEGAAEAWGCDLSEEYVRINADYTT